MSDHGDHDEKHEHEDKRQHHKGEIVELDASKRSGDVMEPRGVMGLMERAKDVMTVRRVYGEPIEKDGVTVIPAANVRGGGGGGSGQGPQGQGRGWGGGFGVSASPAGAFVIKDGVVKWRPAIDVNRTIIGGQIATIVFLLVMRSIGKALAKRR